MSKSQSSILDPFQDTLQPCMWMAVEDGIYVLKDEVRLEILEGVRELEKYTGLIPKAVNLYGGAASYQYSSASDIDISVYVEKDDNYKKNYEEYAGLFKSYIRETCGLEIHYFLKPPYLNDEVKEASEAIYDVYDNKWIVAPTKYDFDPKVEWKEKIEEAVEIERDITAQLDLLKEKLNKLKYEQKPYCSMVNSLNKFVEIYDTLREKRNAEHQKLLELDHVSVFDRASQAEINWKYLDMTGIKDKLAYLKKIAKKCPIDK